MTAAPLPAQRNPVAANLDGLRRMLDRDREPDRATGARRRRRLVLAGAAVTAVLIFALLLTLDGQSVAWWEGLSRRSRRVFQMITRFGQSDWLLIPSGAFALALLMADWQRTGRRVAASWIEIGNLVAFFFLAIAASGMVTNLLKWTIGRARPILFKIEGVFSLSPISFHYEQVSFPSGHTTTAAALAMALVLIFRGRPVVFVLAAVFAVSIAVSRVGVRAHFPSDVVAGFYVGTAVTFLLAHFLGRRGIAFQRQADGTLMPKTAAIRHQFGSASGRRAAFRGLGAAWFGARRDT
jgi:undecaprenyl-diphosphatase